MHIIITARQHSLLLAMIDSDRLSHTGIMPKRL